MGEKATAATAGAGGATGTGFFVDRPGILSGSDPSGGPPIGTETLEAPPAAAAAGVPTPP